MSTNLEQIDASDPTPGTDPASAPPPPWPLCLTQKALKNLHNTSCVVSTSNRRIREFGPQVSLMQTVQLCTNLMGQCLCTPTPPRTLLSASFITHPSS